MSTPTIGYSEEGERALVTVQTISEILPIPGADNIELARVRGWQTVVKKGEFKAGNRCAFFEIDSFLPYNDERYAFLMNKGTIVYQGKRGYRLRTVRLRGQLSQGLVLPLDLFPILDTPDDGLDLTEAAGVIK